MHQNVSMNYCICIWPHHAVLFPLHHHLEVVIERESRLLTNQQLDFNFCELRKKEACIFFSNQMTKVNTKVNLFSVKLKDSIIGFKQKSMGLGFY